MTAMATMAQDQEFLEFVVKALVDNPDAVHTECLVRRANVDPPPASGILRAPPKRRTGYTVVRRGPIAPQEPDTPLVLRPDEVERFLLGAAVGISDCVVDKAVLVIRVVLHIPARGLRHHDTLVESCTGL